VVAWDEVLQGQRVAAARELNVRPGRDAELGPIIRLAPDGPSMYPVLAPTNKGWPAVWTTGGEMSVIGTRVVHRP
jgi:hypothetical protein